MGLMGLMVLKRRFRETQGYFRGFQVPRDLRSGSQRRIPGVSVAYQEISVVFQEGLRECQDLLEPLKPIKRP